MSLSVFSLFLAVILAIKTTLIFAQDDNGNFYSKRYDSIDVDTIFRSSRLLNNYVDCLLDKKPCPPEGKDLKRVLPQALHSKCSRCTKIQKQKALDVVTRLYYHHPSTYLSLAERYDQTGEYTRNFERWYDEEYRNRLNSQIQLNEVPQKTRIPSTWITKATTTSRAYPKITTSRPTLRTLPTAVRTKLLPNENLAPIPVYPLSTERPILLPRTTTTRSTTTSRVIALNQPVQTLFDLPANQQFLPQNQQGSKAVNLIPTQPINLLIPQQPVTKTYSSTFSTTTELPTSIITNPTTSSFHPIQQMSTESLSSTGVSTLSTVSTSGATSTFETPLSIPTYSNIQLQDATFSSNPVQQVPSIVSTQSSVLTSAFDPPLIQQNENFNIPRQPINQLDPNFIDDFFVPRRGLIRRSVNQILGTTREVMRAIFRVY